MSFATLGQMAKYFRSNNSAPENNYKLGSPPPYSAYGQRPLTASTASKWNPKGWSWKTWLGVGVGVVAVIIAVAVGTVYGIRANEYPDYSPLNYTLADSYAGSSFFDQFNYFTGYDPTSGFVHYVDSATASSMNLTYASSTSAILRVDTSETDASTGRKSVRITSKNTYNSGLFLFDVIRSPYGCGTWPALWLTDPSNWPENGEIDVMEGVNTADNGNQMTLHTREGCKMDRKRKETGTVLTKNCWNETDDNAGCGVRGPDDTFGEKFNTNGGGIYAMELRDAGIRVWFFDRTNLPTDLASLATNTSSASSSSNRAPSSPNTSNWGKALSDFPSTDCDISSHFRNQSIIANIDLCGTWAGETSVYTSQFSCPGTCTDYVAQNAEAFENAVWEFGGFWVYSAK